MRKIFLLMVILVSACLLSVVSAYDGLDGFLSGLNGEAKTDMNGFTTRLKNQFGILLSQVHSIMNTVNSPADAFMCLQLISISNRPLEQVLRTYKSKGKHGWGAMAKELGVKPGSAEFHSFKNGTFSLTGKPSGKIKGNGKKKVKKKDKSKGKSKEKGHNK